MVYVEVEAAGVKELEKAVINVSCFCPGCLPYTLLTAARAP